MVCRLEGNCVYRMSYIVYRKDKFAHPATSHQSLITNHLSAERFDLRNRGQARSYSGFSSIKSD